MQKYQNQKNLEKKAKRSLILKSLFFLSAVLFVIQIVLGSYFSTSSDKLVNLEQRYLTLVSVNESLEQEINQESSLVRISKLAEEMGFVKPSSTLFISESLAKLR